MFSKTATKLVVRCLRCENPFGVVKLYICTLGEMVACALDGLSGTPAFAKGARGTTIDRHRAEEVLRIEKFLSN